MAIIKLGEPMFCRFSSEDTTQIRQLAGVMNCSNPAAVRILVSVALRLLHQYDRQQFKELEWLFTEALRRAGEDNSDE